MAAPDETPDKTPGKTEVIETLLERYPGTVATQSWGETAIFLNPGRRLPRGVYFATVKEKDGENDRASRLDRPGVFRVAAGLPRPIFVERFGPPPPRPGKGGVIEGGRDFTALDRIVPHPVYGWMSWIAVLNPSRATWNDMAPLLDAAFARARTTLARRKA
jgi:hypothetical protein